MQSRKSARVGRASVLWTSFSGFLSSKFLAMLFWGPDSPQALTEESSQLETLLLQRVETATFSPGLACFFFSGQYLLSIIAAKLGWLAGSKRSHFSQQASGMRKHMTAEIRGGIFILQYPNPMTSNFLLWNSDDNNQIST